MGLTCDYTGDIDPGMVCWERPRRLAPLATKRSRKCASCGVTIKLGQLAAEWPRYKVPEYDVEIAIWGEEGDQGPPRASRFHCADCNLIAEFLHQQKYIFPPTDDVRELSKEHAEMAAAGRAGCL